MLVGKGIFRKGPTGPTRPSHFREDPNVRTDLNESTLDYPDTDMSPDSVEDYGWPDNIRIESPVPVYQVAAPPGDKTLTDWSAATYTVSDNPIQIGETANRSRRRMLVRNLDDANSAVILREQTDNPFMGFTLPAGAEVELTHNHSVWVRALTDDVEVTTLAEFDVEDLKDVRH